MTSNTAIPNFPVVALVLDGHGGWAVSTQGINRHTDRAASRDQARVAGAEWIAQHVATPYARPVRVTAHDGDADWTLTIAPDGAVDVIDSGTPTSAELRPPVPADRTGRTESPLMVPPGPLTPPPAIAPQPNAPGLQSLERPAKASLWDRLFHRPSAADKRRAELVTSVRRPLRGPHRIAIVCLKGGIGKTTTAAGLGLTLAEYRGDGVIALDSNPDAGDLQEHLTGSTHDKTLSTLAYDADLIDSQTDLSHYTTLANRLWVVGADQEPEVGEAITSAVYERALTVVNKFFPIVVTDCGTGVTHDVMRAVLDKADTLIVAAAYSVTGARRAAHTIEWLSCNGYTDLPTASIVALTDTAVSNNVDRGAVRATVMAAAGSLVDVPFDEACATGGTISLDNVGRPTTDAWLELAARVADRF